VAVMNSLHLTARWRGEKKSERPVYSVSFKKLSKITLLITLLINEKENTDLGNEIKYNNNNNSIH
jgi:hypothetical protein